jgi:ribonuclease P protein subunit RPR2
MPHKRSAKDDYKAIAAERIERLFELAEKAFEKHPELADRYVKLAWKISTRYNVRLSTTLKRKFCRKCLSFWKPGASCRVRVQSGCVTITCLRCGHAVHQPFKPKKQHNK